jgi:hypothetical protein
MRLTRMTLSKSALAAAAAGGLAASVPGCTG